MLISIRKIFFNLKVSLLLFGAGVALLMIQLFHIAEYGERLGALKNQHLLIEKIISTDLNDPQMASILIKGAVAEIELSVKLSGEEAILDSVVASNEEQASLLRSLSLSSEAFRQNALSWSESLQSSRENDRDRMINARTAYLSDIDRMVDYQIHIINEAIATAKMSSIVIFVISFIILILYRFRLNQIYSDLEQANAIDISGSTKQIKTEEIDFIIKRLNRKSSASNTNPNLINTTSGLNNEKGLINLFNAKKSGKAGNTIFLALFEIDHYASLASTLSKEDFSALYKKLADLITMYEQPLDVLAHLEDNRIVFLMSRSSKDTAIEECESIIHAVKESTFNTAHGPIKITLSAGFLLKPPAKSIDEGIVEAIALIDRAKENGGNRVAQLRERSDPFRNS